MMLFLLCLMYIQWCQLMLWAGIDVRPSSHNQPICLIIKPGCMWGPLLLLDTLSGPGNK
jgi:hypothetical protein